MNIEDKDISFLQDSRLVEKHLVFDGEIMRLYHNKVQLDNGQTARRELVHHDPAVGVLALTPDKRVALVKQYRPAVAEYLYEIPAGLIDRVEGKLEEPLKAAQRELEEETSMAADKWKEVTAFYLSPGMLNEKMYIFLAQDIYEVEDPLPQDADEAVEVSFYTLTEIKELLEAGHIKDAKTAFALVYLLGQQEDEK